MISLLLKPATRALVGSPHTRTAGGRGFALVVTLTLMVLLGVLAVGMLSLSAVSLRTSSRQDAMSGARANARLALMIAIGELQKEMGPDMRVSAKSAIFDQNPATEAIDGVEQPHWLASYESWGNWLNASYQNPGTGETLDSIRQTYTPKREKMFRRWLLSLPAGMEDDINAPMTPPTGWDDTNSVVLVGEGSAGSAARETRAYLTTVTAAGESGRSAWWIGPENHKARIDKAKKPRPLSPNQWETAQGDTAEVGIGALTGLSTLDSDATLGDRLMTLPTLVPAGVDAELVKNHFFDLTEASRGVLASVRTGHLKKDLSLLFEGPKADLPDLYRFDMTSATPPVPIDVREPSIRPMSPEIANRAVLGNRHFASWTRMRHFYRMYRRDSNPESDEEARVWANDGIDGSPGLQWSGTKPWAGANTNCNRTTYKWTGEDTYVKYPVLTNLTYILSLKTDPVPASVPAKYYIQVLATPVWVYWNPYNVELRIPNRRMAMRSHLDLVRPLNSELFVNGALSPTVNILDYTADYAYMHSEDFGDVIFKPGQFRIFSPRGSNVNTLDNETYSLLMLPGFDPNSYGGLRKKEEFPEYEAAQNPQILLRFGKSFLNPHFAYGNTPGSLNLNEWWSNIGSMASNRQFLPFAQHISWCNTSQFSTFISNPATRDSWVYTDSQPLPVAYFQWALKGFEGINANSYPSIDWEQDWRCRNWLQAPPFYHGKGLYVSEDPTIAHTQRIDSPFELRFGPLTLGGKEPADILPHVGESALMGTGDVTAVSSLELPSAPIGSLGGFGSMAIDPGWVNLDPAKNPTTLNPDWKIQFITSGKGPGLGNSLYRAQTKATAYQSGITGPGIGNSFLHPMIPRTDVYQYLDNSKSMDMVNNEDLSAGFGAVDTKAYCDYWDHVLLLNDALWDDYFVSSLADQTRPGASVNVSLDNNLDKLVNSEELANSRYLYHGAGKSDAEVKAELKAADGYLKAAAHLMVDGMFNVNSTSVAAWQALFAGIRERQVVYRDASGTLRPVEVPADKRIALSRFGVETTNLEGDDPEFGVDRDDGMKAWSGVRFLDDAQIRKLAEECVKQVKRRGPFLNFSEFINRRLANDDLGTMGALQSAIDYDDASPESGSINYNFKSSPDFMLSASQLGTTSFQTPEAAEGSRFAGIPGYVIQSDILRPIANTLSVRDDTFRIRAYGDSLDKNGNVIARAWCEAVVQRFPEYCDESNAPEVPARLMTENGVFSDNSALTLTNRTYGRKFHITSFRWLSDSEI